MANLNSAKHDVSFEEATTAFRDQLSVTAADPDHSVDEERFITYGFSSKGRLLLISHTERGEVIRIINAKTGNQAREKNI